MPSRTAFVSLAIVIVAGCAASPGGDVSSSLSDAVAQVDIVRDCPNFVTEVETGSEPTDFSEDGPLALDQARLTHDIETANEYALAHADEFGSIRFENSPRVRIVIGFTDNLAAHCSALRDLLQYPDDFELVEDRSTQADLLDIEAAITSMAGEYARRSGIGAGGLGVQLRADGEAVAAQIAERFGDLVTIWVGAYPYPDSTIGATTLCRGLVPPPPSDPLPFVATLELTETSVRSGADFDGTVTVTNTGDEVATLDSGSPMTALVFRRGTDEVVGIYTGGIAGVGAGGDLAPGETLNIDVIGGTASCDPALGYALPAGAYDVRVAVDTYEYPNGQFELHAILSMPVALEITE